MSIVKVVLCFDCLSAFLTPKFAYKILRTKLHIIRGLLLALMSLLTLEKNFAQVKIGDNEEIINPNSLLELESSQKGLLLPRLNSAQMLGMNNPPNGMMIYNNDSACVCIRRNNTWRSLCSITDQVLIQTIVDNTINTSLSNAWRLGGNAETNPNLNFIGTTDAQGLSLRTNSVEVMRLTPNRFVGIGTNNPTNTLHIVANANPLRLQGLLSGASSDSVLTVDANGVVRRRRLDFNNIGGDNLGNHIANPILNLNGNWLSGDGDTEGVFVNNTGDVGIGTVNPTARLHVAGNMLVTGYLTTPSDIRLKTNIKTLNYGLNELIQLNTIAYTWKDTLKFGTDRRIGVVAQEVQRLMPELVVQGKDSQQTLTVAYNDLIPVLINAIKELNKKLKENELQINDLKNELKKLKTEK